MNMKQNYIVIFYLENEYKILGQINISSEDLDKNKKTFYINDKYYILEIIAKDSIFSSSMKLDIILCRNFADNSKSQYKPVGYSMIYPPKILETNDSIVQSFYINLLNNKINLKSYFRKNKIAKLLNDENITEKI